MKISCNFSIVTTFVYCPISETKVSGAYGYYNNNGNNVTKELLIAYTNNNMVQYDTFWIGAIFVFRIYQLGMISRVGIFVTRYQYIIVKILRTRRSSYQLNLWPLCMQYWEINFLRRQRIWMKPV